MPVSIPATTDRMSRLRDLFDVAGREFAPRVLSEPHDLRGVDPSAACWHPRAVACRPDGAALEHASRAGLAWAPASGAREEHILWGAPDAWNRAAEQPQLKLAALALEAAAGRNRDARLMGVLNVTPDSFSDGGRYDDPERAVRRGLELLEAGATWLDIGGESTRPGADTVPVDEERRRTEGVVRELRRQAPGAKLSIDTRKSEVAAAALDAGADLVNDVSGGLFDPRILEVVAEGEAQLALMHMQGEPRTMQRDPRYEAVVADVTESLRASVARALDAGIGLERLWVDPGIGFGKRLDDNLDLIERVHELHSLGLPLLVGVSRKSFLGTLTGVRDAHRRVLSTAVAVASCVRSGAQILRVHDVAEMREALAVSTALHSRRVGQSKGGDA